MCIQPSIQHTGGSRGLVHLCVVKEGSSLRRRLPRECKRGPSAERWRVLAPLTATICGVRVSPTGVRMATGGGADVTVCVD